MGKTYPAPMVFTVACISSKGNKPPFARSNSHAITTDPAIMLSKNGAITSALNSTPMQSRRVY
jgi:hypothetical protein